MGGTLAALPGGVVATAELGGHKARRLGWCQFKSYWAAGRLAINGRWSPSSWSAHQRNPVDRATARTAVSGEFRCGLCRLMTEANLPDRTTD
jgi:hypothetical protein